MKINVDFNIAGQNQFYEHPRGTQAPLYLDGVRTCHNGHSAIIEMTGPDTATGSWAMEDKLWFPPGSPIRHLWGVGWYFEKYRKDDDGQWRILELKLRRIRVEVDGVETIAPDEPMLST